MPVSMGRNQFHSDGVWKNGLEYLLSLFLVFIKILFREKNCVKTVSSKGLHIKHVFLTHRTHFQVFIIYMYICTVSSSL